MAIRIEKNLFYVESKGLSIILENRDGYLMLKHLGRPIPSYHFPIPYMRRIMLSLEIQHLTIEPSAWIPNVKS